MLLSRNVSSALAIALMLSGTGAALAQEFSSADVTKFFLGKVELEHTRGICVGTAEVCKAQEAAKAKEASAGFDVMVTFEKNSDALTSAAISNLTQVAVALADERLKDAKFVVEGHTDASGQEAYNDKLSERRAKSVAAFLTAQGVSSDRMTSLGLGEKDPRVPDPFDPSNRRVEMKLSLQ